MIRAIARYFGSIPPVFLDGWLCVQVATLTGLIARLASDDAVKWIPGDIQFWAITILSPMLAGTTALQFFRSKSFAEHRAKKDGETQPPIIT